ncbi:brevican core protein-like [Stegastes partitus]|uniref:Brevican core protein-like n=2 Tax=Stegastes partitus TaxID=144197 RepID=A0A9Y4KDF9_9TELE|nr:PREDICTED: brevican core protein-like [Stegastes partitus]
MLLRRSRHVQLLPLLCAVCSLTLAFPTQTPSAYDEVRQLQVNIPHSGPVSAPLGSSTSIPCLVSLSSASSSSSSPPVIPRVKWTVVSGGVETQILVARGQRVKVNELYRDRAALLNYTSTPNDLSLWLGDLRSSDSGHYRCEVQQGLEDASDLVQLKVKGVVFHYRDAFGRYSFSFRQAQRACEAIGAQIATPDQLLAAYYDGYEQCDAGWLADQSVRYPIQVPREGCYGDMDGQPGVRNYGTMDPDDLFDVYCYIEQIDGEVFHDSIPQQISFGEAQSYCRAAGAELATTAQLYSAWSEGLDRCSPGWLSDGSVRYPIITPRERCGGVQAGVKTIYRFSNQTGFPEPSSLHDVYCFRENRNASTDSPMDYMATETEDIAQNVVILLEKDQELQMNQQTEHVEREAQSVLESLPFFSVPSSTEENLVDTHPTVTSGTTESTLHTTSTLDLLRPSDESLPPTEPSYDSTLINSTISSTHAYNSEQNTSFVPHVYNETDSHQNFTFHQLELEETTEEPQTENQTVPDANKDEKILQSEEMKEMQETDLGFDRSPDNYSETESNHTQEESFWEVTSVTSEPVVQVKLEEAAAVEDDVQITTQASKEEGTLLTQPAQANTSTVEAGTSLWAHMDGSGDMLQESDLDVVTVGVTSTTASSTSIFTTHPSPSASASSAPAEPQTALPDPTLSSGPRYSEKLGFDIFSTASQLWESISRQEGSTSVEAEDTLNAESEEKQLHTTTSEHQLVSGVSLVPTESPDALNASRSPIDSATAGYHTPDYRVYLDTVTSVYEEASGHEPGTVTATLREDIKFAPNLEEEIKISPTLKGDANGSFSLGKEVKVSPTLVLEEEANASSTLQGEAVAPSVSLEEEANIAPTLEEEFSPKLGMENNVVPTVEEEDNVVPTAEEEASVGPTLEEEDSVGPSLKKETTVAPTPEEEDNVVLTLEEEDNVVLTIEEKDRVGPTLEEEGNVAPTLEEEGNVAPTLEEEDNVAPTLEEEDRVGPTLEEEINVVPTLEEEANISATLEEEANVPPALEAFTISPLNSQTSQWALLSTTTEPQESLNELEYSHETSSTAASDPSLRTKPTSATAKTTTTTTTTSTSTTTHWSRRTWSPATTTPRVLHEIPPVDHGLLDVELSLTQPPTLLILPNERAAVGGAGKFSDACEDDPCLNGGTCTDQGGQVRCLCLPTYGGDFCQRDLERCEPGWDKFHGFCYRHFSQRLSWEVAEQHCRMLGAHLVSIITPEEQSYINSNYKEYQWTGLNDKTIEGDFRWSDGNPLLYENWYRGQPDSYFLSGEDCVVMVWHDDGRWSDVPCNYHLAYTCKKGTTSCGPPPKLRNAFTFGKTRQRYETNAVVRYHCAEGFQQRLNPLIRCLSGGIWERPQILCIPEAGGPTLHPDVTSPTDGNFAAAEDEFEATKETPQYWDIKF